MATELVGPLEEMLEHVREALTIYCRHSHKIRDKTTRDYLARSNNRLIKRLREEQEPSESPPERKISFAFFATSVNSEGKVDGQGVSLEEVF